MGQVPKLKYLLIGSGRLARHLSFYFKHLNLNFDTSSRRDHSPSELNNKIKGSDVVLLAISDGGISSFYDSQSENAAEKIWVHFSGALHHPEILGFHPLMSFGSDLYDPKTYLSIPFISEMEQKSFEQVFPELPNPHFKISKEKKALYHAYCVMGGNFTQLLWWMVEEAFEKELGLPAASLHSIKSQVFSNTLKDSKSALTGPLVRGDSETIEKNILALEGNTPALYREFVNVYQRLNP